MRESARTDLRDLWGSNPPEGPGPFSAPKSRVIHIHFDFLAPDGSHLVMSDNAGNPDHNIFPGGVIPEP